MTDHPKKRLTLDLAAWYPINMKQKQYDELVKHLMHQFTQEFVGFVCDTDDFEVLDQLDTELQTIKVHRTDMAFKVRLDGEEVLLHIEAQTEDSRDKPMSLRVLAYTSALMLRYELTVYSVVLYLGPNAGRTDTGIYSYGNEKCNINHKYQVIRLADLESETFLNASSIGLLPFTPLMKPAAGMSTEEWLHKCIETTKAAPVDSQTRATLLLSLSIFGSLAHDPLYFQNAILEATMQESPFYQLLEESIEKRISARVEKQVSERVEKQIAERVQIEQGIEQGIARGRDEVYQAWYADWERRRQEATEKGVPFNEPPPPKPENNGNNPQQ